MVYKHVVVAAFRISMMLSLVKLLLKGEVGVCALNSHGNYIVDHGKSWKNHGIVFLNFCGNPCRAHSDQIALCLHCFLCLFQGQLVFEILEHKLYCTVQLSKTVYENTVNVLKFQHFSHSVFKYNVGFQDWNSQNACQNSNQGRP